MGKPKIYQFIILKNYHASSQYEIVERKPDVFSSFLEKLGLKKEAF